MMRGRGRPGSTRLWGRERERGLLDELLSSIRQGESRSLVLCGDAGIGKTALLEYLVASASDINVAQATGVESEMELAYASLHQLCAPMLDHLERLPGPQHDALRVVFGLSAGPAPDRFLVGLAVLSLLSEVAERRPLLCVLDDSQWLDHASALALAFVARRLLAEPEGLVFAARVAGDELRHIPHLEVRGLVNGDARRLLDSTVRFALDQRIRDRIIAETRGNPLALVELPRGLTPTQLAGVFGIPEARDVSTRIETHYARRAESLPSVARRLLLVAAAEPLGDPVLLHQACERLGIDVSAVEATDDLLSVDERVTFRHPLARSAVYWSASAPERRATHLALAAVTDRDMDPDRRAWHLATAAAAPDEEIALELERSASRAQARGGLAAAAAFMRRAVRLTSDPARRAERALAAAQASLAAGAFVVARELLAAAETGPLAEVGRARLERVRAQVVAQHEPGRDAPLRLLRAAKKLETLDVRLSRDTYLDAWAAALYAGGLATTGGDLREVSRAAATAPQPADGPLPRDLLLDGLSLIFTQGRAAAAPVLRRSIAAFAGSDISVEEMIRWGWVATRAANVLWDYDSALRIAQRAVQLGRERGALEALTSGANTWGQAAAFGGDFETAAALTAEFHAVKEATGSGIPPLGEVALAGLRGREGDASPLIAGMLTHATALGQGAALAYAYWARSVLMNGLGRYEEALAAAAKASDESPGLFTVAMWGLSELIEAAVRTGDLDRARAALARLDEHTDATPTDWALGLRSRSVALVSDGDTAEDSYREAVDRLGRTRLRPELARAHLLFGEWLRREDHRRKAREHLRTSYELFVTIGMEAFAERARRELRATGETVRRRLAETRDDLTAHELQIARLARDGLSNPEIGAQLFISPRTVEWHLHHVFAKLHIQSRKQLATALSASESRFAGD